MSTMLVRYRTVGVQTTPRAIHPSAGKASCRQTTLATVDGMHISSMHLAEIDSAMEHRAVFRGVRLPVNIAVKVDHIAAEDDANEAVG